MCQLEQTLWLPSMSVQPAITDLLRATYTADGTDAQLLAEYDRRRNLDPDADGDWVCPEISDQAIADAFTPADPNFILLMMACLVGQVKLPKLGAVNPSQRVDGEKGWALSSLRANITTLQRRSARALGLTYKQFNDTAIVHWVWGGKDPRLERSDRMPQTVEELEPRSAVTQEAPLVHSLQQVVNRKRSALRLDPQVVSLNPHVSGAAALQFDVLSACEKYAELQNYGVDWATPESIVDTMPMVFWCVFLTLVLTITQGYRGPVATALRWPHINLRVFAHGAVSVTLDAQADGQKFGLPTFDGTFRGEAGYPSLEGADATFAKFEAGTQTPNVMAEDGVNMGLALVQLLIAFCIATGRLARDWESKAVAEAKAQKAKRSSGPLGDRFASDYVNVKVKGGADDHIVPLALVGPGVSIAEWAAMPNQDGREYDGPTRDLLDDDARARQASRDCVAMFALIGWFGFTLRMLRCGWLVEEFIHDMTVNVGMIPASFFERVRIHNRWSDVKAMEPYIRAAVNCRFHADGRCAGVDRRSFIHGFSLRVVGYAEQYALDVAAGVQGRELGWVTFSDIDEAFANDRWFKDNAMYDLASPYFRVDRDDALFFSACEALFLPAAFAKLKAKYAKLEMDARASLAPNGENRVAVEEEKLRQRRALDAKVVEDVEKEWRIRFTKEQIGFGSTARQSMASGSMRERR